MANGKRKIALVHDWLTGMRGGEKVLEVLCEIFPSADIYTLIHIPGRVSAMIERHPIYTSYLSRLPGVERHYRRLLPLMPDAIGRFNFDDYELLISTSHCVAKGAIPGPRTVHWSYSHTPMRYIWDQYKEYFGPGRAGVLTRAAMTIVKPFLRRWDVRTTDRVHHFLANSENVRERIQRIYHRESQVLYPPVDFDFYSHRPPAGDRLEPPPFYLIVSALAPYKRIDLAISAFNRLGKRLLIIGDGPEKASLQAMASPNIHFSGWMSGEELRWHYARCQALIFPGEEDFGIVPLEAMSAGRPVVAYHKGGTLETVIPGVSGVFFNAPTAESLLVALETLESQPFSTRGIQEHAQRFSRQRCIEAFRRAFVEYSSEMS